MSLNMENIYCTEEYQNHVSEYDWLYESEPHSIKTYTLDERFTVEVRSYTQEKANDKGTVCRSRADKVCITDDAGNILIEYKSVQHSSRFTKIIKHSNEHEYLLFNTDLYGYSVMDLHTREIFNYFPSCSLYRHSSEETFIWCNDIHYNTENNLLAVGGCYWAAPSGVILVDFENPMKESLWADTHKYLDPMYEVYDDIDFKQWDGENLVLEFTSEGKKEIRVFSPDEYMKWFSAD